MNPVIAATATDRLALPKLGLEPGIPSYLTLTYRQSARVEPFGIQHQLSSTLADGTWLNVAPDVTEILPADPVTGDPRVRVKFTIAPDAMSEFARLLVTP